MMKHLLIIGILIAFQGVARSQGPSSSDSDLLDAYLEKRESFAHSSTKAFSADEQGQLNQLENTLKENYPASYAYHIVAWLNSGYSLSMKDHLLKAANLRPDETLVNEELLVLSLVSDDRAGQKKYATKLKSRYSTNTLNYYRDLLPEKGVLVVSGKADAFPVYVLQHVYGEGSGLTVVNLDLMRNDDYKKTIQRDARIGQAVFLSKEKSYLNHLVTNSPFPVTISATVHQNYLSEISSGMFLTGLGYKFQPNDQFSELDDFWSKVRKRDLAAISFASKSEKGLYANYLPPLLTMYKIKLLNGEKDTMLRAAIVAIAAKVNKSETVTKILEEYELSR